MTGRST